MSVPATGECPVDETRVLSDTSAPPESAVPERTLDTHHDRVVAAADSVPTAPEDRPSRAFDGDPSTAWRVGEFDDVRGKRIRIVLDHPITTDHVNLVQVLRPPNERYVTGATMRFDGKLATPAV